MILNSRRTFLKNSFLSSVILLTYSEELLGAVTPLQVVELVYKDLFPEADNVPSMSSINAKIYLNKILHHTRVSSENKIFIRDGVQWLNEESIVKYEKVYTKLSSFQRQKLLKDIADTNWGDSWIETILSYFLEAMLGDPVYGGNKDGIGWKWLNHKSGLPRPAKALL
ncbi:MAG: gluconate 2-dehydrogenase subunit 3 family protein [Sulfurimonas sp.]|nr:gluconate 2-dehydrogenase subunit 3 family protein [Sulfurimonas sp.]MCK4974417.1 gluconate 2-dehydrogenase subunit 3 family protein [Sulfurimonas sp.]